MPINGLPLNVKPREKAKLQGITSLSDIELLALFLRNGASNSNVLALSQDLLTRFGSLKDITLAPTSALRAVRGIGKVKALELKALAEFGRRFLTHEPLRITSPAAAAAFALGQIIDFNREQLIVICLTRSLHLLHVATLYKGTSLRVLVEPQDIVALVLKVDGRNFYCVHNHPSGDVTPSEADKQTTYNLTKLATVLNLQLLAHLVINSEGAYRTVELPVVL